MSLNFAQQYIKGRNMRVIKLVKEVMTKVAVKVLPVVTVDDYNHLDEVCNETYVQLEVLIIENLKLENELKNELALKELLNVIATTNYTKCLGLSDELDEVTNDYNNLLKDHEWLIADANKKLDIAEGQRDETVRDYNDLVDRHTDLIEERNRLEVEVNMLNYQIDVNEISAAWEIMDEDYN